MKKFGYTILRDRTIDIDHNDHRLLAFLRASDASFNTCIGCGSCTATCTAAQFVDFNIRRVHTFLRRGETHLLKKEIQRCMFCGKCQMICPRGVNMRNLILTINRAIEQLG